MKLPAIPALLAALACACVSGKAEPDFSVRTDVRCVDEKSADEAEATRSAPRESIRTFDAAESQELTADATAAEAIDAPAARCVDWKTLKQANGTLKDCYPYRCKNDRCLTRCRKMNDCAGSQGPGDFAEHGWPLECILDKCVPMDPDKVYGQPGPP